MSNFQKNDHPRAAANNGVWGLAALSVAACLCSVLGAKTLSHMFDEAPAAALAAREDAAMRQLAASAPKPGVAEKVTIVRSIGVDGLPTATIFGKPLSGAQPLNPCEAAK